MLTIEKVEHILRPYMARTLSPKFFTELYSTNRKGFLDKMKGLLNKPVANPLKETEVCGIKFRNDLGNAAGLDKDGSLLEFNYFLGAGFAIVGTVLDKPHTGNLFPMGKEQHNPWVPLPNSKSALNSLGLPSLGVDKSLENIDKFKQKYSADNFPIGLSIMGHPAQEGEEKLNGILTCVEKAVGKVDFIEINESCPNVAHKSDDGLADRLNAIAKLKKNTPIFVKLGALTDANQTIDLLDAAKMDGLVLLNTQKDYDFYRPKLSNKDHKVFDYYTNTYQGGLSGEIIKETSVDAAKRASEAIKAKNSKIQLIHVGGISNKADVQESRKYAPLREWYTGMMDKMCSGPINKVYSDLI
ncbi:MAG: hypothetical protein NE330_17800 [Lentisphaeraceae bacterium]|nr:hypothetical protein [Lentisphaeraceae bacterium]